VLFRSPVLVSAIVVALAIAARDFGLIRRSLWTPGILLFCLIALPWYVAVQLRNPEFFRVFILQHNLARFGTNLYHHPQPIWFYLPIVLLAVVPWTIFVIAACSETIRAWWAEGKSLFESGDALNVFLVIWLLLPIVFFSLSRSKLPGYILPAIPAGALLLTDYLRRHLSGEDSVPGWLFVLHALLSAAPVVPALMIQYILLQHGFPWGRSAMGAVLVASLVAIGIAVTLSRPSGLRLLRFVTLVPVVLAVAVVLRIGGPSLDETLSASPLARELSGTETHTLPIAVFSVPRETDYGLAFYRDQQVAHYEEGQIPSGEHLLIAPEGSESQIAKVTPDRRVSHLGTFAAQHLDYYWVSAPGMMPGMKHDHAR
jgi:4-amino-4-deoxy-L-arabinose transferase-like glycosyltransferase